MKVRLFEGVPRHCQLMGGDPLVLNATHGKLMGGGELLVVSACVWSYGCFQK